MLIRVPYTQVVYTNPVWTVADILGNIAYWEEHVVRSVAAFRAGVNTPIPISAKHG